ncbi:NAD(P)-binding protein [Cadophora sp. DSE1049]|nr:NAD(P)-binding protein [Cadophora sp. DSE1049]
MSQAKVVHWGILATGSIAKRFVKDLLISPQSRGVADIKHQVTAVGSSSSTQVADSFVSEQVLPGQNDPCATYGSYEDLVKDSNVDIIYIATPHSRHFQDAMLCLNAGKSVLIEKPLAVNARQASLLCETAQQKNLFLMEALWTRFLPISTAVQSVLREGVIGEITRVTTDLSISFSADRFDTSHRMVNLELAGGGLLDLGVYNLSWIFEALYHPSAKIPKVAGAAMIFDARTGIDTDAYVLLEFADSVPSGKSKAHGLVFTSFALDGNPNKADEDLPSVRIQGGKGEIRLFGLLFAPSRMKVVLKQSEDGKATEYQEFPAAAVGMGMFHEADEAARCFLNGKLQSDRMRWSESIGMLEVMDEARKQTGLKYPEEIETTGISKTNT